MKEKIRKIHDEIKNHPYWLTFEDYLKPEIWNLFTELQSAFYSSELFHSSVVGKDEFGRYYYNNPQVCLICKTTHDFNANFHKVTKENIGNYIVQLQSYLSLYHYLIDESNVAVYTFKAEVGYYVTWRAIKTEQGWAVLTEIPKTEKENIIKNYTTKLNKLKKKSSMPYTQNFLEVLIKDIEENNEKMVKFV